jgi:hypothetical protein
MGVNIGISPIREGQILRDIRRKVTRRIFRPEIREMRKLREE